MKAKANQSALQLLQHGVKDHRLVILDSMELMITKTTGGNFYCQGQASFHLETIDKAFGVGCKLPQASPPGLTLAELVKCFSDLDIIDILVVKDLVGI